MSAKDKAILTCALTGVLTDPKQHPVPVTPARNGAWRWNGSVDTANHHHRSPAPGRDASTRQSNVRPASMKLKCWNVSLILAPVCRSFRR